MTEPTTTTNSNFSLIVPVSSSESESKKMPEEKVPTRDQLQYLVDKAVCTYIHQLMDCGGEEFLVRLKNVRKFVLREVPAMRNRWTPQQMNHIETALSRVGARLWQRGQKRASHGKKTELKANRLYKISKNNIRDWSLLALYHE